MRSLLDTASLILDSREIGRCVGILWVDPENASIVLGSSFEIACRLVALAPRIERMDITGVQVKRLSGIDQTKLEFAQQLVTPSPVVIGLRIPGIDRDRAAIMAHRF